MVIRYVAERSHLFEGPMFIGHGGDYHIDRGLGVPRARRINSSGRHVVKRVDSRRRELIQPAVEKVADVICYGLD